MKPLNIHLETERLIMRNLQVEDVTRDYAEWLNDPEINRYLINSGKIHTMEDCITYVNSFKSKCDKALIGIFNRETGLHLGNITLSHIYWHRKIAEIGICVGRKEYHGKGIASEALKSVIDFCFSPELKMHRLIALTHAPNETSTKLFKRCGFKIEGRLRDNDIIDGKYCDAYFLGLLRSDLEK